MPACPEAQAVMYDWEGHPPKRLPGPRGPACPALFRANGCCHRAQEHRSHALPFLSSPPALSPATWSFIPAPVPARPGGGSRAGVLLDTVSAIAPGPSFRTLSPGRGGLAHREGKLRQMVGAPIFRGYPTAFWSGCDAVARSREQQYLGMLEGDSRGLPGGAGANSRRESRCQLMSQKGKLWEY